MTPRATLEAIFPMSGRTIKLRELDGHQELAAAKEAGDDAARNLYGQVMRSIISIDGTPFEQSAHTPESTRAEFSAVEWQLVLEAFSSLHRPEQSEVEAFRASFRHSAESPGD